MMSDDILGRNRNFEPSRKPILREYSENYRNLDPELRKLRYVMISPSNANREYSFWNDSVSQSFAIMTAALITGDGLRIRCDNQRAKTLIEEFNENINVNGQSIDDYITRTWIDELIHGRDYWRIAVDKDYTTKVDIQRLDPKTITLLRDDKYGWTKLIQKVPNYKGFKSKRAFYRNASLTKKIINTYGAHTREIHIPDEPDVILRNNFFIRPPIAAATHFIVYKRFILYFMRKFSQRLWTPLLFFKVGDSKSNYYPVDDEDMQRRIDDMATLIPEMTTFSAAAIQGDVNIEEVGKNSARSSTVFVDYINMLDKQIMMAQFASMGLRDASGTELATSSTLKEMYLQFIRGIRRKYKSSLENFYAKGLCKANRIHLSPTDLDLEYSTLKFEPTGEYMSGLDLGVKAGVFRDRNEVRKAAQVLWGWLEDLPKKENTRIQFPIEKMMPKPTPVGGAFGKPAAKPAAKPKPKNTSDRIREYVRES